MSVQFAHLVFTQKCELRIRKQAGTHFPSSDLIAPPALQMDEKEDGWENGPVGRINIYKHHSYNDASRLRHFPKG
jgi:hypothetical protein